VTESPIAEPRRGLRTSDNTGPPARAAVGGPRPNRPRAGGLWSVEVVVDREQNHATKVRAGSEALNVIGHCIDTWQTESCALTAGNEV